MAIDRNDPALGQPVDLLALPVLSWSNRLARVMEIRPVAAPDHALARRTLTRIGIFLGLALHRRCRSAAAEPLRQFQTLGYAGVFLMALIGSSTVACRSRISDSVPARVREFGHLLVGITGLSPSQ